MRDVLLLRVSDGASFEHVIERTREILSLVYSDRPSLEQEVWVHRRARMALIQSVWSNAGGVVPMHRGWREAFAYTGFVSAEQYSASALRERLSMTDSGDLRFDNSPGGIASYFLASARHRRCFAWSSHAGIQGIYFTRGTDCIAVGSSPLASHLAGTQRDAPTFSRRWARRVLLGGYTLWDDTPYEQTYQTPPRSLLVLEDTEIRFAPHPVPLGRQRYADRDPAGIDDLAAAALEAVSVLRRWPAGELQLSGGKDSRFAAALLCRAGIPARYVTHATASSGEGTAAAAVARVLGVPHEVTGGPGVATGEELLPTILSNLRLSDGMLGENRQLACPQLRHAGEPLIQGHAHHGRGGFRARATRDRPGMTASLISSNSGDAELVADDLVQERRSRLDEILNGYQVKNVPDLAYWLYNDWRMTRWINAAYRAMSTFRPVVWPLMDERVLRVIAELSSFDRLSEVAFYRALRQLKPELGPVPLYENTWRFDAGPIGATELADGFEARQQPFKEQGKGGPSAERRLSTVQSLFRLATTELRHAQELRSLIRADVLEALSSGSNLEALGRPGVRINFMWKVAAIALVMEGNWLPARIERSGIGSEVTGTGTDLDASQDPTQDDVTPAAAAPVPTRRFRLQLPARQANVLGDTLEIEAPSSYWIPKELQGQGLSAYEPETLSCFLASVEASRPGVVLDIGANVGVFAWLAARLGGRNVIAFEPTPEVAACAVSIAALNRLAVEVEPTAVGGEPGTVPLYLSGASDLSNSTRAGFRRAKGTVEVAMDTVDRVCQRRAVEPAVLKIDTESTEPEVLRGAASVLATYRPWIICEVLGASTEARLQEILEPYGYVWFQITHENPLVARREIFGDRGGKYRNWLFAPSMPDAAFWKSMGEWRQALTRTRTLSTRTAVPAPALLFDSRTHDTSQLGWAPRVAPGFEAAQQGESMAVSSTLEPGVRVHFFPGQRKRDAPDAAEHRIEISPSMRYELQFDVEAVQSEMPGVHLLAGQYDRKARIREQRLWVRPGTNVLAFDAHARARSLRLALRFSGPGKLTIGPIKLYRVEGQSEPGTGVARTIGG